MVAATWDNMTGGTARLRRSHCWAYEPVSTSGLDRDDAYLGLTKLLISETDPWPVPA